jgi:hypothetical protein
MADATENSGTEQNATEEIKVKIPIEAGEIGKTPSKKAAKKAAKKQRRKRAPRTGSNTASQRAARRAVGNTSFPKHSIASCIRIPKGILDNNAGKECTNKEAAGFANLVYNGEIGVEISSAIKYLLLERPSTGKVKPTEVLRRIVRPQNANDAIDAMREGVQQAPVIGDVYKHYRGENLPETQFLKNTVVDTYGVPEDKADFFISVFIASLEEAKLLEDVGDGKKRVLDVMYSSSTSPAASDQTLKKLSKGVTVQATDTCFVMQPFAAPLGGYYATVYAPAIEKAGLKAVRADDEIFGTGKIIDQIWTGINSARVLVAELTSRNANVFYELGLAHALHKPVILVSSNKQDVPFDITHVRVIYYDVNDPFWGNKLIEKIAENIIQALKDPKDAILFPK